MKIYALLANGRFYDAHNSLVTTQKWFNGFATKLAKNQVPHHWFNQFLINGEISHVKMEIVELETEKGKVIHRG